jgi:hypothetical protein
MRSNGREKDAGALMDRLSDKNYNGFTVFKKDNYLK